MLAQGHGAHASQVATHLVEQPDSVAQRKDLAELMHELADTLGRHAGELADETGAQTAAEEAAAEVAKYRPDVSRVRRLLEMVGAASGPVSEIAAAVLIVHRAISGMP